MLWGTTVNEPPDRPSGNIALVFEALKAFFGSPFFFILLGIGFLLATYYYMDRTHPTFLFLLAILGVSIVLYGTGTQGVGTAQFKEVPVTVFVAGGAGVLAAVVGLGVVWQGERIQTVFSRARQFGLVILENNSGVKRNLNRLYISAKAQDGRDLHLISTDTKVQILVPITLTLAGKPVCITVFNEERKSMTAPNPCPTVTWTIDSSHEISELVEHVGRADFPMVQPKQDEDDILR